VSSAAERRALEDLKKGVYDLADGVDDMRRRAVDEATVERIARDVMQGVHGVRQARRGFAPPDSAAPVVVARGSLLDLGAPNPERLSRGGRDRLIEAQAGYPERVAEAIGATAATVREFQAANDALAIAASYLGREPEELDYYRDVYLPALQAMDSSTSAEGIEWVPKELSGSLIERISLALVVASLFPTIEMPTQPFELPGVSVNRQRTATLAEQTADTGQTKWAKRTPGTRKVTLTAAKFGAEIIVSRELEEDGIIAIIPWIESELVDWLAADFEDAVVNGDTTGTHQDSDVTASDDPRKAFMGLRKSVPAGAKTDASNAALTVAMLRTNRSKMGKYGTRAGELAHVVPLRAYVSLLSDANVLTVDKYGPRATILTGELGKLDGAPLVVSEYVRQDLNASGVHDGVTATRTVALTVHRGGFVVGQRRQLTVQVLRELYAESDQDAIIASFRRAFAARFPSTETTVALHYNVA
jgi:hypothetical protein